MLMKNRYWSFQQWKDRLKLRWAMRGSVASPMTTTALPTEQQQEKSAEQKFKEARGFSMATAPLPWSEDIAAHNKAIDVEYDEEIARRKVAFLAGEYKPRFLNLSDDVMSDDRLEAIVERHEKPTPDEIDWRLEMTLAPGRRVNVTTDVGVPMQPVLSDVQYHEARMAGALGREVKAMEQGTTTGMRTPRDIIGSRASIVEACRGDERMADQVEASARQMFNVEDLDTPLPEMKDAQSS